MFSGRAKAMQRDTQKKVSESNLMSEAILLSSKSIIYQTAIAALCYNLISRSSTLSVLGKINDYLFYEVTSPTQFVAHTQGDISDQPRIKGIVTAAGIECEGGLSSHKSFLPSVIVSWFMQHVVLYLEFKPLESRGHYGLCS